MEVKVLDTKGKEIEKMKISKDIFDVEPNESLLLQYIRVFTNNQRQGNASTKTRADVSGTGKKPWQQKHTGRARVGSSRNPLWRHGGISHGPKPKSWFLNLPKKVKNLAIKQALSLKFKSKNAHIIQNPSFDKPNTSEMLKIIKALNVLGKTLYISKNKDENIYKSLSNIKEVSIRDTNSLSAYDILVNKNLILTKDCVLKLEEMYK